MLEATPVNTSICRVEVFRSQALVTRRGSFAATAGTNNLRLGGLPLGLDDSSVRAMLRPAGALRAVDLHIELELGERGGKMRSQAEEDLTKYERRRAELMLQRFHLREQLRWLRSLSPIEIPEKELPEKLAFESRPVVEPRLRLAAWVREEHMKLREARRALQQELRELEDRIAEAKKKLLDESRSERERLRMIRKAVRLVLESRDVQPAAEVELSYVVRGAAWAPVYQVRVSPERGTAELTLGALLAQKTGEDWPRCQLSLSTADLERSCELPELHSWRIGKVQPPPSSGWRELPEGLEALFEAYDAGLKKIPPPPRPEPVRLPPMPAPPGLEKVASSREAVACALVEDESVSAPEPPAPPPSEPAAERRYHPAAVKAQGIPLPCAPPAPSLSATAVAEKKVRAKRAMARSAPAGGMPAEVDGACLREEPSREGYVEEEYEEATGERLRPGAPAAARSALEFQDLRLMGPEEGDRGQLQASRAAETAELLATRAEAAVGEVPVLPLPCVSEQATGHFAVRYQVEGQGEIAADGQPCQITLMKKELPAERYFSCLPAVEPYVYQEAKFSNPFGTALLAGPVRVYLEGDFVAESHLDTTAPGKPIRVNLGVESAISVARHVHFEESSAGLMGGTTLLRHRIENTVHSKLPRPAKVYLFERLPVSDTPELEVKLIKTQPTAESYDQAERGALVRGGLRFTLELAAREKKTCTLEYQIQLPNKQVLVGGNRRE